MDSFKAWKNYKNIKLVGRKRARLFGALVLSIVLYWFSMEENSELLQQIRTSQFDIYQNLLPREKTSGLVKIVAIDEASLKDLGQWPWPRSEIANLVQKIGDLNPAAIGLDIIFTEPDRFSPQNLKKLASDSTEASLWLESLPDHDERMGEVVSQLPIVVGVVGAQIGNLGGNELLPPYQFDKSVDLSKLNQYQNGIRNISVIDRQAMGHGIINAKVDPDGVIRTMPLTSELGGTLAPSLSLDMLRIALGANWYSLGGDKNGIDRIRISDMDIETLPDASLWIHYAPAGTIPVISAKDILDDSVPSQSLANQIVLVGVTGLGLVDYHTTPIAPQMTGTAIHAQVLDNILVGDFLTRPTWAFNFELLLTFVLGLIMIWLVPKLKPGLSPYFWVFTVLALNSLGFGAFSSYQILINTATPILGCSVLFFVMLATVLIETDIAKKQFEQDLEIKKQEEARISGELEAARRIQSGILPDPEKLDDPRVKVSAILEPARDIGGDFYDVFMVDQEHLFFLIGDVSGKGIPAALFMALGKSLYKSTVLRRQRDIAKIMTEANAEISRENPEMLFITVVAGLLNLRTGELRYCNAGHDSPLLIESNENGNKVTPLTGVGGPPLCVLEDYDYPGETITLAQDQTVLLFTDGVTEAMNSDSQFYGMERFNLFLADHKGDHLVESIQQEIRDYEAGGEPADDLTLVAVKWLAS